MKRIEAKKYTPILQANWQYPLFNTYRGLQLNLVDGSMRVFNTKNPTVDFINYKQFLIEKGKDLLIDRVRFAQSFVDFLTLEDSPYRIAYFDNNKRVDDSVLAGLSAPEAMSMFDYYICKDNITHIDDLRKLHQKVMRNVRRKDKELNRRG